MAKVKWKRTREGIKFIEQKTWAERLQSVTFMQAALTLFFLELFLLAFCLVRAVLTGGQVSWLETILGFLILVLGGMGVGVTCYGHYSVEAESKIPWKTGLYTNGAVALVIVAVYVVGIFV